MLGVGETRGLQFVVSFKYNSEHDRTVERLRLYWRSIVDEPLPPEILMLMSILERNERDYINPSDAQCERGCLTPFANT